jgi:hypothetical protein
MAILLLINEQEIKDVTPISDNVDSAKFRQWIQVCQDVYIKPSIGETCYDALLDGVENDDLTALETTLLDGDDRSFTGIKTALAWWVYWKSLMDQWINTGNSTVQKRKGENFDSVSIEEFEMKRKEAEDTATYYTNYLIDYIIENKDDYTCYSCEGLTPLIDETNSTGIALDNDEF